MKPLKGIILAAIVACGMFTPKAMAQQQPEGSRWYWGIAGGLHSSRMSFSDINESYFPTNKNLNGGIFSVFVQGEFGKQRQFAIRPQLSFLNRGGKLTEIDKDNYEIYADGTTDIYYKLKAHYLDVRIPLIYNFGKASSKVRPYVFVAPVLGIATGGNITLQKEYENSYYEGYNLEASEANLAKAYFSGQVGAGLKFAVPVASKHVYLGLEASYQMGITDTYGSKEKDGEANDIAQIFNNNYKIRGTRKLSGFELQAVLSVPFDIFKRKAKEAPAPQPIVIEQPIEEPKAEEKPCYTLDEIITLMANNENVEGKTICAIDAIGFDFGKSTIKKESYGYLDKLAQTLIRMNKRIEVRGHTDNVGSDDFNMQLSRERAEAVVSYLVSKGVDRNKLTYTYYGKTRPLSNNDTEEGRAMNRRVEFNILNNY